jgi:hypothetical protein
MVWESVYADSAMVYIPVLSVPGTEHIPDISTGSDKYNSSHVAWLKYTPGSNGEISIAVSGSGDDAHAEIKTQQKNGAKNRIENSPFFILSPILHRTGNCILSVVSSKIQKIAQL